jgi:hypothetical protein
MTKFDELMDIITHNKNNGKNGYIKDEDILFMKTKVKLSIFLFFGLVSLIYVFPFVFVEAAKLESGVTINAPSTTETEKICDDTIDNDNDGKIDAADEDCAGEPAGQATATCGLQISGVPINYGPLSPGGYSATKIVKVAHPGSPPITRIVINGGNWISDSDPKSTLSGPQMTHVYSYPAYSVPSMPPWEQKQELTSSGLVFIYNPYLAYLPIYFQIKVPSNATSGSFHQEIDIVC